MNSILPNNRQESKVARKWVPGSSGLPMLADKLTPVAQTLTLARNTRYMSCQTWSSERRPTSQHTFLNVIALGLLLLALEIVVPGKGYASRETPSLIAYSNSSESTPPRRESRGGTQCLRFAFF